MNVHRLSLPQVEATRVRGSVLHADELVFGSEQLLKGRREIVIRHGDKLYRLRHTSNDKLILTK